MGEWDAAAAARLRMLSRESGTQDDLVERTGIPKATLQRILAGKSDPGQRLETIAKALGVNSSDILGGGSSVARVFDVKVYDVEVAAGAGRIPLDDASAVGVWPFPMDWVVEKFGAHADLKMVRVSGDSQEPDLRDGDSVVINTSAPRLTDGMHVVRLDDALMIKRIQVQGANIILKSANPQYDPINLVLPGDADRFAVIGKAVWVSKLL